jgi:hypothetical protein
MRSRISMFSKFWAATIIASAAVVLVCAMAGPRRLAAQASNSEQQTKSIEARRIAEIMHETVREGIGATPEGIRFSESVPPSNDAVAEIKRMGEKAVPILTGYLWSKDDRESALAMRFLGSLGGSRMIKPLADVARSSPSPERRTLALQWLTTAPWADVSQTVTEVSERDADPGVRRRAKEIIAAHTSK